MGCLLVGHISILFLFPLLIDIFACRLAERTLIPLCPFRRRAVAWVYTFIKTSTEAAAVERKGLIIRTDSETAAAARPHSGSVGIHFIDLWHLVTINMTIERGASLVQNRSHLWCKMQIKKKTDPGQLNKNMLNSVKCNKWQFNKWSIEQWSVTQITD